MYGLNHGVPNVRTFLVKFVPGLKRGALEVERQM